MHAINPAFITLLQLWKNGSNSFAKKGKGKESKLKFKFWRFAHPGTVFENA